MLRILLSFAVGGLLGDVFLHLLPEAWQNDLNNTKRKYSSNPLYARSCGRRAAGNSSSDQDKARVDGALCYGAYRVLVSRSLTLPSLHPERKALFNDFPCTSKKSTLPMPALTVKIHSNI